MAAGSEEGVPGPDHSDSMTAGRYGTPVTPAVAALGPAAVGGFRKRSDPGNEQQPEQETDRRVAPGPDRCLEPCPVDAFLVEKVQALQKVLTGNSGPEHWIFKAVYIDQP